MRYNYSLWHWGAIRHSYIVARPTVLQCTCHKYLYYIYIWVYNIYIYHAIQRIDQNKCELVITSLLLWRKQKKSKSQCFLPIYSKLALFCLFIATFWLRVHVLLLWQQQKQQQVVYYETCLSRLTFFARDPDLVLLSARRRIVRVKLERYHCPRSGDMWTSRAEWKCTWDNNKSNNNNNNYKRVLRTLFNCPVPLSVRPSGRPSVCLSGCVPIV